jgi:hypothetical protein
MLEVAMRRVMFAGTVALLFVGLGSALSACSATASEPAIPYGYCEPGYYADSACFGPAPLYGDFAFDGGWGYGWRDRGHPFHAHFGHEFGHGGFGHGGFGHGGGHGR